MLHLIVSLFLPQKCHFSARPSELARYSGSNKVRYPPGSSSGIEVNEMFSRSDSLSGPRLPGTTRGRVSGFTTNRLKEGVTKGTFTFRCVIKIPDSAIKLVFAD